MNKLITFDQFHKICYFADGIYCSKRNPKILATETTCPEWHKLAILEEIEPIKEEREGL